MIFMEFQWEQIITLLIIFSVVFVIIIENRHPVKTLAWCMILAFIPVFGVILYILFGMNTTHRRLIKSADQAILKGRTAEVQADEVAENVPAEQEPLIGMMRNANKAFPLCGNKVEVYTDFRSMADNLVADIENARHHVHVLFFKFENDSEGKRIADAMIRKAKEGLDVRFLYDDVANLNVSSRFYRKMKKGGVQVKSFIRIVFPILSQDYNFRNHRKLVVIDGKTGYMGGMNIAKRYALGLKWGKWRDTHMKITGPAVSELQTAFLTDWQFVTHKLPSLEGLYPYNPPCGDTMMQIVTAGPLDRWNIIMQGFMRAIAQSRRYVYIQSPYFIPTEPVLRALQNAALGGVDVRIMIPYRGDRGVIPALASRSYVKEALEAGINIYFYQKGYMHAKTMVCDDNFVTIGSTNFDFRSFEQDFEINAFMYDRSLAVEYRDIFIQDQQACDKPELDAWLSRPLWERFKESFARIFSPLL